MINLKNIKPGDKVQFRYSPELVEIEKINKIDYDKPEPGVYLSFKGCPQTTTFFYVTGKYSGHKGYEHPFDIVAVEMQDTEQLELDLQIEEENEVSFLTDDELPRFQGNTNGFDVVD